MQRNRGELLSCTPAACIFMIVAASAAALPPAESVAGGKAPAVQDSAAMLQGLLRDESTSAIDRRARLAEIGAPEQAGGAVGWQSGFVRRDGEWVPFEKVDSIGALDEYRRRRGAAALTAAQHLRLAGWCRERGLADQEQAHLHAAAVLDPEGIGPDIFRRLGYRVVAGRWLSREQLLDWQAVNRRARDSLKRWHKRLARAADSLSGSSGQRERALAQLSRVVDPSAIPAIEYVLSGASEGASNGAVALLAGLEGHAATLALAKQAVFSGWESSRTAAIEALKERRFEDFVPDLIALLSTPLKRELHVAQDATFARGEPVGELLFTYLVARETESHFEVAILRTLDLSVDDLVVGLAEGWPTFPSQVLELTATGRIHSLRGLADRVHTRDARLNRINERIAELNGRVARVLSGISGRQPVEAPDAWWDWWYEYSDLERLGPKRVVLIEEVESIGNPAPPTILLPRTSCFAAGTPVWTETGLVPIEQIQIGDRVLAKDVETGELAYKPVLQTSVRPPRELTTLRFADETIVCTGGHRFWASGSGWVKARDLAPQTLLHTATGSTPVWISKQGHSAETYNLVVADFHTYFVGKTALLCQDLLLPRPTDKVVPGLEKSHVVSAGR